MTVRLIITTLVFWLLFSSTAAADVIFPGDPPRPWRPRPRYPVDLPVMPPVPPPIVVPDESWHPNIEPDPETTPEEAGFAIVAIGLFVTVLSVREARRSERRPA